MGESYHCCLGLRGSPSLGDGLILSPRLQVKESHHSDDGVCPFEGLLFGLGGWDSETHPMGGGLISPQGGWNIVPFGDGHRGSHFRERILPVLGLGGLTLSPWLRV